jgi:hypothetical protein
MKTAKARALVLGSSAVLCVAFAQLPSINRPKLPGLGVPSIPGLDRLIKEEPAITTALTDALTEIPFLDDFNPRDAIRLSIMPRNEDTSFKVFPGDFMFEAQSYCLHAGTHGPSKGEGYLLAPIKGPKAEMIRNVLQRSVAAPEIEQNDVQVLIWEIQAKVKPSQLSSGAFKAAHKLLTEKELASLEGSGWDLLKQQANGPSIFGSLPGPVRQVMEAENNLRGMFYQGNASYAELENVAVLSGEYKPQKGDRTIPRGRWSYHPDGYFIRYFPDGYPHTTEYIYFPERFEVGMDTNGAVSSIKDPAGRAVKIENGEAAFIENGKELGKAKLTIDKKASDKRIGDFEKLLEKLRMSKDDAKKLGALADVAVGLGEVIESWQVDVQQMAYHAWMASFVEARRLEDQPLYALIGVPHMATGSFDPSGGVATPGDTGRQRLAQSSRCKHTGPGDSDLQNSVMGAMRSQGFDVGPDNILVYEQGGLRRFVIRMSKDRKPLPTADCIAESGGAPGLQEGAKELMFGSVQSSESKNRTAVRSVDVETGAITGAGRGDGPNSNDSTNAAFKNYRRW